MFIHDRAQMKRTTLPPCASCCSITGSFPLQDEAITCS
jgi:hypothetical protein